MASESTTIDQDLYEGLQQARKKKPRNFVLLAKGVEVVGLIVQKKPITDGVVQKAKTECKGNLVIRGVCHGEGVELRFEVVGEEPSITPKKIKEFIGERTELTVKPYWAVVGQLSAVVDDEAPPAQATATTEASPQSAPTQGATDATPADDPAVKFNERLKAMLPFIKAAAGTAAGEEAKLKASEAGVFARKKEFVEANKLLDDARDALKRAAAGAAAVNAAPAAPQAPPVRTGSLVEKRKFLVDRWKRIPEEVRADLAALESPIQEALPQEDAKQLIKLAEDYLAEFYNEMKESIDDDINAGDAQYKAAIGTIADFRTQISEDPLIMHLKDNTLNVAVEVESILLNALAEVEQSLAS